MPLDPYAPCPWGTGKKLKFSSKDLLDDFDQILTMMDRGQRLAALEKIEALLKKRSDAHPGLLTLKTNLQIDLGKFDDAKATVALFREMHPENSVGYAQAALMAMTEDESEQAVFLVHQALAACEEFYPPSVVDSLLILCRYLLDSGDVMAARAHLLLYSNLIGGDRNNEATQMLIQIGASRDIPLLLKQDFRLAMEPKDASLAARFEKALDQAGNLSWGSALKTFQTLSASDPAVLKNVAILRSWLGGTEKVARVWRDYAKADGIDIDDAIEAEALAQMFDVSQEENLVDIYEVTCTLKDVNGAGEKLLSHPQAISMPFDPSMFSGDDQTPPRQIFQFISKAPPTDFENATFSDIPEILSTLLMFGRTTDSEPKLMFEIGEDRLDEFLETLRSVLGEAMGDEVTKNVSDRVEKEVYATQFHGFFPREMRPPQREKLQQSQQIQVLQEKWPQIPQPSLKGMTPADAAKDAAMRVPLEALLLRVEAANYRLTKDFDFNTLREQLGLEPTKLVDPTQVENVEQLPAPRAHRLDVSKLTDHQLVDLLPAMSLHGNIAAQRRIAEEAAKRAAVVESLGVESIYRMLFTSARTTEEALHWIDEARDKAAGLGKSPATWLITELSVRLPRGDSERCQEILQTIQSRHINEPGVAQSVYQVLQRFGIVGPDGSMQGPPAAAQAAPPAEEPASTLWTGNDPPQSEGGGSKLWVPGMD